VLGMALSTVPAALLMQRIGRRRGFLISCAVGVVGALLAAFGLARSSFLIFCLGGALIGGNAAFMQQYRFAAAESASREQTGRAVSLVLLGGVASGFLGPELGRRGRDWLAEPYAGAFLGLTVLYLIAAVALATMRDVVPTASSEMRGGRRLRQVVSQPGYLVAVLAAAVAYWTMSSIMTATPLHLVRDHGFTLQQVTRIVQSHIAAMFVPSLFSGLLLGRFGIQRIMLLGVACMAACVALAIASNQFIHYLGALVLLGLGWNFLFVSATVLLTHYYRPEERFRAQAANDLTVFLVQSVATLSAGAVLYSGSWQVLNLLSVPLLAVTFVAAWRWVQRSTARVVAPGP
ncbi:MAG: MFS transporter, partial [Anaerolineae bacterium]